MAVPTRRQWTGSLLGLATTFGSMGVLALSGPLGGCSSSTAEGPAAGDAGAEAAAPTCGLSVDVHPGVVRTTSGPFEGELAGETYAFRGMPFAQPPVGEARFRGPTPATCQDALRPAKAFGAKCVQWEDGKIIGAEDCLTLNVWTPKAYVANPTAGEGRAVMVFVHGGAHVTGSASDELSGGALLYEGRALAESTGAVVVTIQYRLGAFGFLAHPALAARDEHQSSGNYGMLDQIEALRWVQANAAAFGGDPAKVLLFGESAGAVSACRLLVSPLAKGLFQRVLLESGPCSATPKAKAEDIGTKAATAAGCSGDVAPCLRAATVEAIMAGVPKEVDLTDPKTLAFDGVVDGWAVPDQPLAIIGRKEHHHVPVILGTNAQEMGSSIGLVPTATDYTDKVTALLTPIGGWTLVESALQEYPVDAYPSPRAALVALATDAAFGCPARKAARALAAAQDEPVYRYLFDHVAEAAPLTLKAAGAFHGSELIFLFGGFPVGYTPTGGDQAVGALMRGYWSRLAISGDPNRTAEGSPSGALEWPRYTGADPLLRLAKTPDTSTGYRTSECDFWDGVSLP